MFWALGDLAAVQAHVAFSTYNGHICYAIAAMCITHVHI